ncbi:hypothetical protein LEP1GSC062_1291 [Leptospira alexanderi serovar Manhao 3 str. L 60]|uniref:Uncharacterized protein n=1 Tax=Leptospira alexanderi serovar Manhao 3 str. L 60 TaxID=1049759 RepID=V6HTZ0_9LEPT|nr:hypothetical protein LEP1GSC062_1291 [Leptospira alexanderi serovar Manhao 3 str. L 60]
MEEISEFPFNSFSFTSFANEVPQKKIKTIKNDIDLLNSNLLFFIAIITRKTKTISFQAVFTLF